MARELSGIGSGALGAKLLAVRSRARAVTAKIKQTPREGSMKIKSLSAISAVALMAATAQVQAA
ncbi:MAG: hypothetical protein AAFN05_12775, partial [Pseudomonadota bacterium]